MLVNIEQCSCTAQYPGLILCRRGFTWAWNFSGKYPGGDRLAEIVSLCFVAAFITQKFQILGRLNTSGNNPQVQALAHADDRAHFVFLIGIARNPLDERPVDLESTER